jgi:hypothetical protein
MVESGYRRWILMCELTVTTTRQLADTHVTVNAAAFPWCQLVDDLPRTRQIKVGLVNWLGFDKIRR